MFRNIVLRKNVKAALSDVVVNKRKRKKEVFILKSKIS